MCRFRQRKAFTIVEMVIVIAVIAILATVLVPTISGVIQQANLSTDKQFAASLNVQLALWQVDNGIITDVDDLQEAIDSYYGDDYFTDELKAKSANQGYQYWYVLQKGVMIVATPDNIYDVLAEHGISADDLVSISAPATAEPVVMFLSARQGTEQTNSIVSLSSKEGGATPGDLYDFGFGLIPVGKGNKDNKDSKNLSVIDVITMFNTIEGPNDYEDAINALHELKERYKDKHEKHPYKMAVDELIEKIETTAIITEAGAFRYGDVDNVNQVYISKTAKYINVENVYHYVEEELDDGTTGKYAVEAGDGAKIANPDTPIAINIPKKAKVAPNGLNFGHNKIDVGATEEECANVPTINVKTNNVEDLKAIFDKMATDCILVTKDGKKYVIIGEEIHEFPLESLENPVVSGLEVSDIPTHITGGQTGVKPEVDVDLTLDPETEKNAGTGSIYYDKTTNILFVAYDRATPFTISTSGAHSSLLEWVITDQVAKRNPDGTEVKDSEGKTVFETAESNWLVRNGNAFTINHKLAVGEDPYVTVTVKVKGTETEERIRVYLVRPTDVLFDLDINTNIAGVYDNAAERPDGINLTFNGEKYLFEIKNARIQYNASGKVLPKELSFSVASSNYFEIVTESGKTYLKLKENVDSYNFSETLIAKYGEDTVEFKINMIDNSASAFKKNPIIDNECTDEECTNKDNCSHNDLLMGDTYLFRVGNENAFELGKLFDTVKAAKNVVLEIYDKTAGNGSFMIGSDSTFKATVANATDATPIKDENENVIGWQISSSNWKNVTIDFDGKGVAQIRIGNKIGDKFDGYAELLVEVVDGKNVTAYSELKSSGNNVLLNDITMSSGSSFALSSGTLFGNGFTFDVTAGAVENKNVDSNYLIKLTNATLDNVRVLGKVYTSFNDLTTSGSYNRPVILAKGTSSIFNCYIANCAAPVRINDADAVLTIKDTTLKGGSLANLDIRGGQTTVENLTTINMVESDTAKGSVGAGILIYYENVLENTRLTVKGSLTQYNALTKSQAGEYCQDEAETLINALFGNATSAVQYKDANGTVWVNTGIMSAMSTFDESCITGNPYATLTTTLMGHTGYLWTEKPTAVTTPDSWKPTAQGVIQPTVKLNHDKNKQDKVGNDYCLFDSVSGEVQISFDEGDTFTYDPHILTATKNGNTLSYTVKIDGTVYAAGQKITFNQNGKHTVTYEFTDVYNYALSGSNVTASEVKYTVSFNISVTAVKAAAKDPIFTFYGYGSESTTPAITITDVKTATGNSGTWIMPSATGTNVVSVSKDGITVNCPVVHVGFKDNSSDFNWLYPVFLGMKIEDYANGGTAATATTIVDKTSQSKPASITIVTTDKPATNDGWSSGSGKSGSEGKIGSGTYSNLYGWTSGAIGSDKSASTIYGHIQYKSNKGDTYNILVAFKRAAHTCPSTCFTPDTLVTLADGTQKRVDELKPTDTILAWDFFTGKYVEKKISLLVNHGEALYKVTNLKFSDGTGLKLIGDHGVFDYDLNKYVYFTPENYADYIGHTFVKQNLNGGYDLVQLVDGSVTEEYTSAWSVSSAETSNAFASGMLTVAPPEDFYNWIEMSGKLQYNVEQFAADVAQYGLYTYEDFADYVTYEQFVEWNGAYLKIAVEKGYFTFEYILELIEMYKGWMP